MTAIKGGSTGSWSPHTTLDSLPAATRPRDRRRRLFYIIGSSLALLFLSDVTTSNVLSDILTLLCVSSLLAATLYSMFAAKISTPLKIIASLSCALIFVSQSLEAVIDQGLDLSRALPAGLSVGTATSMCLGLGIISIFLVSCTAVLELGAARDQLVVERERLARESEERERTQQALVREKTFTDQIIDGMPGIFCLFDEQGRLLRWNTRHAGWDNYTKEELRRANIRDWFSTDQQSLVDVHLHKALEPGGTHLEANISNRNGQQVPYDMVANHFEIDGVAYFMAIGIDISERKLLEQQLRHAQKMELIGRLAGGVAHDFNNLLQAILGLAEMAHLDLDPDSPTSADLEEIMAVVSRATLLVQQLLAFSRKQVVQPTNVHLDVVARDMVKMLRHMIAENITVEISAPPDLEPVLADRGQLEQVVLNLCVNARDAMPDGGRIWLTLDNLTLTEADCRGFKEVRPGHYVSLRIRDTGHGMSEETRDRIFEPFFTTKEAGRGTGLGLSTVYSIVSQHHGMIRVESAEGMGTEFIIHLPRSTMNIDTTLELQKTVDLGGTETILLAEDDAVLRRTTIRLLEHNGYHVIFAQDGEEAIRLFDENRSSIDLVFVDFVLPKASGEEILHHIREQHSTVPVLFASGLDAESLMTPIAGAERVQIIQKPYEANKLYTAIRGLLDN